MATLSEQYLRLKTGIGGNREKRQYEDTFGMPKEEAAHITLPNSWHRRILAELEFVLRLSQVQPALCEAPLSQTLTYLLSAMDAEGVLTKSVILEAEAMLAPVAAEARSYNLILAGHAHIDMNWMWSWQETVAATLDTFRTMLAIMDEYPNFCFSQSQASVYRIVEEFDPEMMERIKVRIAEGRWEVTASSWVEQDKNMPSTESMARHQLYTKQYLQNNWGIDPATLDLDFSPDTFGHSANMPEIIRQGGVQYYYHCRGTNSGETLYRWRAPSGAEVLVYREPYWYNSAITPHIGAGLIDLSKKCGGLKTGLVVYGVGNHGGGPTRRDIERALDMMQWPVYPTLRFGGIRDYFKAAESVREKLTVVEGELNFIFTGCYTTQSRIKAGNRRCEAALGDAEALNAMASALVKSPYRPAMYAKAWKDVLFTHFHDILTGSCVQDAREHAMGLYGDALAVANTNRANAMRAIAARIDSSRFLTAEDISQTQAEGAGPGFGVEILSVPGPSQGTGTGGFFAQTASRGTGINRLFHLFNPSPHTRQAVVELTIWDWTGDLARISFCNAEGVPVTHQLVDVSLQNYWDHKYFRVLVDAELPPLGYATYRLSEAPLETYPLFFQPDERIHRPHDDYQFDNGLLRATFDRRSAQLVSLVEAESGREWVKKGDAPGLRFIETESDSSDAWKIGRYLTETKVDRNLRASFSGGPLRQQLTAEFPFAHSTAKVTVSLDKGERALRYDFAIDWHEVTQGDSPVAMLAFVAPSPEPVSAYRYDVPGGSVVRGPQHIDVPGLQYGAAMVGMTALTLVSESKYGYRGADDRIGVTLLHAARYPDPDPERGLHRIRLALSIDSSCPKTLEESAFDLCHAPGYLAAGAQAGTLPMNGALLSLSGDTGAVLSGIKGAEDGDGIIVRLYNTFGEETEAVLTFALPVASAVPTDAREQELAGAAGQQEGFSADVEGRSVTLRMARNALSAIRVRFA